MTNMQHKITKYKHINTNKSMHSEMGSVWQKPLMTVKRFSTQYSIEQFW